MRRLSGYQYGKNGALALFALLSFAPCARVAEAQAAARPAQTQEQAVSAEPAPYRAVVDEAKREYDLGHFVEARALFAKAIALYPNAKALRGRGMTEFELRNYGDCVASLEQALDMKVRPLEGDLRKETEQLLDRARSFVARVEIAVDPGAAVVLVDGVPIQLGSNRTLVVESGPHIFEFRADGYAPEKVVKKYIGGEQETVHVVLPRDGAKAGNGILLPDGPGPTPPDDRKPLYKNPWLWGGVAAVAVVATGVAIGLASRDSGGGTESPPVANPFASMRAK